MKSGAEIQRKYPKLLGDSELDVGRLAEPAPSLGEPSVEEVSEV